LHCGSEPKQALIHRHEAVKPRINIVAPGRVEVIAARVLAVIQNGPSGGLNLNRHDLAGRQLAPQISAVAVHMVDLDAVLLEDEAREKFTLTACRVIKVHGASL